ncbi:MAG TPA: Hsp20/alpha crystallin family protein [Acidimicrobiales bacterium]|jgi:HSP20 family molecular chaperone IbpA|nr:Hsp20/alpha crystallin family protein [Acidimicrobiales bacterium]
MASDHPRHTFVEQATEQQGELPPQTFPVNMYEAGDALVIVAPLPAVAPDDVSISVAGDRVVIEAALRTAAPKDYLLHEWRYGGYRREIRIPAGFGASGEASLANGQLAVRILRGTAETSMQITPTAP